MKHRIFSIGLAALILFPTVSMLGGCGKASEIVLRVYNWEEYIDEGGEGTFIYDELHELDEDGEPVLENGKHVHIESDIVDDAYKAWYAREMGKELSPEGPRVLDDFCLWYERTHGQKIRVEYSTFGTNEDMYNEIKLGNEYDLLCPSDYMIMKLAAEGRLEKYDDGRDENGDPDGSYNFFDPEVPENYYVRNVSPFIAEKFENNAGLEISNDEADHPILWKDYAAGYMWGTTGFVYNPNAKDAQGEPVDVEGLLEELGWKVFTDSTFRNKITAKDNVRDTYFAGLGLRYQDDLLALRNELSANAITQEEYIRMITEIFNATDDETITEVEPVLRDIKKNIHSFETDTGKSDMVKGTIWLNYAWSGDAVYALDLAESGETEDGEEEEAMLLNYYVPKAGTNLWFDGWVMPKGVSARGTKEAAEAFVNFLSMPQNAMRNSYYIGYTSVISGEEQEMLGYADYLYGEEEGTEDTVEYDLSYFFGGEASILANIEQATCRQLYAQFPTPDVISHCAVMDYYNKDASERINELWSRIKAETLDAWAIIVIVVAVLAIALSVVFVKFGDKIDLFRAKPKKGYRLIKQEDPNRL